MSAIAGVWRPNLLSDHQSECDQLLTAQQIFGPDKSNLLPLETISIGRNLKQLLPEDRFDRQPVSGSGGRYHLVADARIDNREELGRMLEITLGDLARMSESALIMQAFLKWHIDCCDKIAGEFAFAIWDTQIQKLFLARDALGMRPLHFFQSDELIAFATMPMGLHALPDIEKAPNLELFKEILVQYFHHSDRSYYQDITKVKPGHYAVVTTSGYQQYRHWNPQPDPVRLNHHQDYVALVRETFDQAVASQLRGETKVATHLSAGLDSAAVTTSAAIQLGDAGKITAYTSVPRKGYDGGGTKRVFDESEYAAQTAAHYPNVRHVLVNGTSNSLLDNMDVATQYYGMPIINLCNRIWGDAINQLAVEDGHRVLLAGGVGNLTFSYSGMSYFTELLRGGRFLRLVTELYHVHKAGWVKPLPQLRAGIINSLPGGIQTRLRKWRGLEELLSAHPVLLEKQNSSLNERKKSDWETRVDFYSRSDFPGCFNKGTLAQTGLDTRDPTADKRLIELCLNIPSGQFFHKGEPRAIARHMLADRIPANVLAERRRGYQGADWHETFELQKDDFVEQMQIMAEHEDLGQMIDTERLTGLIENMPSGNWNSEKNIGRYRVAVLRAATMGDFIRRVSGANR